jgi:prepilin-type N-terminal cleavage/methylation domain-containing protein
MSLAEALRSERGFTLAELLVACAVIALVMAGLLVSLQAGQEAYLRGSNEVEATQSVRVAIERMAQELRVAGFCPTCTTAPPIFTAITAQSATGFTIQNDWDGDGVITAAGTVTDGFGNVRGEQIVYAFAGGALTRQETGVDASPLTLATGINSLTFTYQDNAGVVTAVPDNIRTVVVTATTQPQFQPAATLQGRVLVTMTDSLRMRNR